MSDQYPAGEPYQQPSPQQTPQGYPQPGYPPQGYSQAPYPVPGYTYPAYAPEPPGKTMGIVGFVLAFVIAPAGIVVSAMALSESKKVGYPNVLGKWGLWLSIAFTAISVLYVLFVVLAVFGGLFAAFSTSSSFDGYGMSV
ncbi:hypothetical protein [Krasilnikoviella flava]|uniref:DUF4190 domain-containing protein n=1 Tax=Krasilnikoviella flava TaxID=526729 RepID=A0A1T5M1A9_9MICO|nr:hypothetical protein [Krasilnikoviella flava]SKC81814.1 hypothetical protein SAMN04324258_4307 [Krasilnikoviella flava]